MSFDRLAVILKVGDQQTAKGKEHFGLKEGMIVDCIDEKDYGNTLENIISEHMRKVYAVVEVPRKLKTKIIDFMAPVGMDKDTNKIPDIKKFRPRSKVLPLSDLEKKTKKTGLAIGLRSSKPVPIINGSMLKAADFKDALKAVGTHGSVLDRNSVTSGNYTVGAGGNYMTWVAAIADTGNLTGDLTFTQISNTTETAIGYISNHLNGHTLKYTNTSPPMGDPTQGFLTTWNTNVFLFSVYPEGSGTLIIEKLYWKHAQNSIGYNPCLWSGSPATGFTCHVRDCMFNGQTYTGGWLSMRGSNITWYVYDNVIWKGGTDDGINVTDANSSTVIENNSVYKFGGDGIDCGGKSVTCRNNACFDNTGYAFNNMGSATFTKCASSDNTGSEAGLRNLITANQFVSTSDTNSGFLDVDPSGALDGTGSTTLLPYNTADIRGRPRPNNQNKVSIGGAEVAAAPPSANLFYNGGDVAGADRTLGNKDNYSVGILTNNLERIHVHKDGNIGFGVSNPINLIETKGAVQYGVGTASRTSAIVTGVGTTFTADMVGGILVFNDGTTTHITGFTDATHLTVSDSGTVPGQGYTIYYSGFIVKSDGTISARKYEGISNAPAVIQAPENQPLSLKTVTAGQPVNVQSAGNVRISIPNSQVVVDNGAPGTLPPPLQTTPYLVVNGPGEDPEGFVGVGASRPLPLTRFQVQTNFQDGQGTVHSAGANTIVGSNTIFRTELKVGYEILVNNEVRRIVDIVDDATLIVEAPFNMPVPITTFQFSSRLLSIMNDGTVNVNGRVSGTIPVFNVLDFGAVADAHLSSADVFTLSPDVAGTDNTPLFQAALDAARDAGGGTVFAPAGYYRFLGTLTIWENVTLKGESDARAIFRYNSADNLDWIHGANQGTVLIPTPDAVNGIGNVIIDFTADHHTLRSINPGQISGIARPGNLLILTNPPGNPGPYTIASIEIDPLTNLDVVTISEQFQSPGNYSIWSVMPHFIDMGRNNAILEGVTIFHGTQVQPRRTFFSREVHGTGIFPATNQTVITIGDDASAGNLVERAIIRRDNDNDGIWYTVESIDTIAIPHTVTLRQPYLGLTNNDPSNFTAINPPVSTGTFALGAGAGSITDVNDFQSLTVGGFIKNNADPVDAWYTITNVQPDPAHPGHGIVNISPNYAGTNPGAQSYTALNSVALTGTFVQNSNQVTNVSEVRGMPVGGIILNGADANTVNVYTIESVDTATNTITIIPAYQNPAPLNTFRVGTVGAYFSDGSDQVLNVIDGAQINSGDSIKNDSINSSNALQDNLFFPVNIGNSSTIQLGAPYAGETDLNAPYYSYTPYNPHQYPWAIRGVHPNAEALLEVTIKNVNLANVYDGIDFGSNWSRHLSISDLYCSALHRGIYVDMCEDIATLRNIYIFCLGSFLAVRGGEFETMLTFQMHNTTAVQIGRVDGITIDNVTIFGAKVGIAFTRARKWNYGTPGCWGSVTNLLIDEVKTGIHVEGDGLSQAFGVKIANFFISSVIPPLPFGADADNYDCVGISVDPAPTLPANSLYGCHLALANGLFQNPSFTQHIIWNDNLDQTRMGCLWVSNCHFHHQLHDFNAIEVRSGRMIISNCLFKGNFGPVHSAIMTEPGAIAFSNGNLFDSGNRVSGNVFNQMLLPGGAFSFISGIGNAGIPEIQISSGTDPNNSAILVGRDSTNPNSEFIRLAHLPEQNWIEAFRSSPTPSTVPPVPAELILANADIPAVEIDKTGNVGIGLKPQAEKLEVNGAIKVGDTSNNNPGTIRFHAGVLEVYQDGKWQSLGADLVMPVGTIISSGSTSTPPGFLYCNGQAVSRTTYSDLSKALFDSSTGKYAYGEGDGSTSFNVPDLRGYFLRGQADGQASDPDRNSRPALNPGGNDNDHVGSRQDDVFRTHSHRYDGADPFAVISAGPVPCAIAKPNVNTGTSGGNETRPVNVYVRYYIKY